MIISERESIARLIKAAAALRGISYKQIGDALNVSAPSISRTINKADIPISRLLDIARVLNMDVEIKLIEKQG